MVIRKGFFKNRCDKHGLLFATEDCPSCQMEAYISAITKRAYDDGYKQGYDVGTKHYHAWESLARRKA